VAVDDDGEIRRGVVGAVVVQRLISMWTVIGNFQEAVEHGANAARWAFE
jgi:hypothetical protein